MQGISLSDVNEFPISMIPYRNPSLFPSKWGLIKWILFYKVQFFAREKYILYYKQVKFERKLAIHKY